MAAFPHPNKTEENFASTNMWFVSTFAQLVRWIPKISHAGRRDPESGQCHANTIAGDQNRLRSEICIIVSVFSSSSASLLPLAI